MTQHNCARALEREFYKKEFGNLGHPLVNRSDDVLYPGRPNTCCLLLLVTQYTTL